MPSLTNQNTGHPVEFQFQINNFLIWRYLEHNAFSYKMFRTLAFTIKIFVSYLIFKNYLLFIWNSNNWLSSIYSGNPNKVVFQVDRGEKGFFGSHSTFLFFNKSNIYSLGRTFKQYFFFFFWLRCSGYRILVPQLGLESQAHCSVSPITNHWTSKEFTRALTFKDHAGSREDSQTIQDWQEYELMSEN